MSVMIEALTSPGLSGSSPSTDQVSLAGLNTTQVGVPVARARWRAKVRS
jgi:hypothetical protein